MKIEEIRANAPDRATHYYQDSYYIFDGKRWYFWNFTEWAITYCNILSFAKPL